jgi:glycosyltransferase involved in cell wall biosynthesis
MKIIIISPAHPFRGGIAQSTEILSKKLKEKGNEVKIINFRRQYPNFLFPGKSQYEPITDHPSPLGNEQILDSIGPLSWIKAFKKIKNEKPDLVIIRYWMPFFAPCFGTICLLTRKYTESKILYLCDNIIPHEKSIADLALTRFAFKWADFFIVQSHFVSKDLLRIISNPVYRVVPHPVYETFGEILDKKTAKKRIGADDEKLILFFGIVREYKGLDLLLKAMPEILKRHKIKLMVAGEFYEKEDDYIHLIQELKIDNFVQIYPEFVESEKVRLYFSAADVIVLPYKSATQSGIVQLAYHFNKPCIVTDVGGLSEVVIDNKTGFVILPENPMEIAVAVYRFYADNKEKEFSNNIMAEKKKYSWDNMTRAIEGFIR